MEIFLGGFAGALGIFGFFGGIALLVWVSNKAETEKRKLRQEAELQERQFQHTERMKALEMGQTLPDADLAFARSERVRAWAAAAVGIVVPVASAGTAVAGTALALARLYDAPYHAAKVCTIWGVWGLTSLTTVALCLSALRRRSTRTAEPVGSGTARRPLRDGAPTDFRERITTIENTGISHES